MTYATTIQYIFILSLLVIHSIAAFSLHTPRAVLTNNYQETRIPVDFYVRSHGKSSTALRVGERTSIIDGFRDRARYDDQFTVKIRTELLIGFIAQLVAEIIQRGDNSINEIDLITADLVQGLIANFFAVYFSAPRKTTRSYEIGKKRLNFWESVPDNAFQKCKDGQSSFSVKQRVGALLKASPKLFAIGFSSMTVGSLFIDFLGLFRIPWTTEAFSLALISSPSNFEHVLVNALATGLYCSVSTNFRYQFVAGVMEDRVIDSLFVNSQRNLGYFIVRTTNTYVGSSLLVVFLRAVALHQSS